MNSCRLCGATGLTGVVDLGATPPCERFLAADQLEEPETTYPLQVRVCTQCWLAQLGGYAGVIRAGSSVR